MLKGRNSRFEAYADKFIHLTQDQMRCIRGTSRSGGAITICDAIGSDISGTHSYRGKRKEFISLFPHYVAIGPRHIETHKAVIAEVMFTLSGATALFYDLGAFSTANIKNIRRLMPAWAKKDRRKITFSEVFYCVDRGPMVSLQAAQSSARRTTTCRL